MVGSLRQKLVVSRLTLQLNGNFQLSSGKLLLFHIQTAQLFEQPLVIGVRLIEFKLRKVEFFLYALDFFVNFGLV